MAHQNASDLVEMRDLCEKFFEHASSQPDEALRYFKLAADYLKGLQEEQSEAYQQAHQFLKRCVDELRRISPILPEIVQGCIEGRDERWFKERYMGLDERIVDALFYYVRE
jgi:hypothetical protein